jgi:hypothetical protein
MMKRLRTLGVVLAVLGLGFLVAGGVAFVKVQDGYGSLQAFSKAQNVELSYDENGQLTDHGDVASAQQIMTLLKDDWNYPVVESDLDPNDPLVNTATEYMFQMATISHHILDGTQTIVLDEDATYNGKTYKAGTPIEFNVDGRYWTDFNREDPVEGAAREMAWSPTAHGLIGELGVGTVTASALQLGLAVSGILAGLGFTILLAGLGLFWASKGKADRVSEPAAARTAEAVAV